MEPKWIDKLIRILYDIGRVYPYGFTGMPYMRIEVMGKFIIDTKCIDKYYAQFNFDAKSIEFCRQLDTDELLDRSSDDEYIEMLEENHRDLTNVMNAWCHTIITKIEYYVVTSGVEHREGISFFSLHPLLFQTLGQETDSGETIISIEDECRSRPTMDTLHFFPMPREEDKEFFEPFIEGPGLELIRLFKDLENHMGHVRHVVLIQRSWRAFRARRAAWAWALGVITEFGLRPGHLLYKRGMSRFYT